MEPVCVFGGSFWSQGSVTVWMSQEQQPRESGGRSGWWGPASVSHLQGSGLPGPWQTVTGFDGAASAVTVTAELTTFPRDVNLNDPANPMRWRRPTLEESEQNSGGELTCPRAVTGGGGGTCLGH